MTAQPSGAASQWTPPIPSAATGGVLTTDVVPIRRLPVAAARRALVLAVLVGLSAQWLLVGQQLGVNVLVGTAILLTAGVLVRRRRRAIDPLDAWLPFAALLFASFATVRTDRALVTFDVALAGGLAAGAIASMAGIRVTRRSLSALLVTAGHGAVVAAGGAVRLGPGLHRPASARSAVARWGPVLRGLLIAVPVVLTFVVLFASADMVFASTLGRLTAFRLDVGDLIGRALIATAAAWVAGGLLALVAGAARRARVAGTRADLPGLGTTEAVTLLLAVDAVFIVFVALQAGYLFGGLDTIAGAGITYAEYARRGFFELVTATVLVGGLLVTLESTVRERSRLYVGLALLLVAATGVVLASGAYRLAVYQAAYGWTELRFFVAASIGWLGLCLVAAAVTLVSGRSRWLVHAAVALGLGVAAVVNLIGPQAFVAQQNVARALDPSLVAVGGHHGLDADYLTRLGDDAIPVLAAAVDRLPEPERTAVADRLERRLRFLERLMPTLGWPSWNLAREEALTVLRRTVVQ